MSSITVSKLVRYLKNKLETDQNLSSINVSGEISNFHHHNSGHLYFTLKDNTGAISCVMFSSRARLLKFVPTNGDKVEVNCSVSIFEVSGQLQLYVNSMKKAGLGDLFQQYEELKNRLAEEGLFDQDHKQVLKTVYPEKVAVLVGEKSAAMSDIKSCFQRRWPLAAIDYYPVLVQGTEAPGDIIPALERVDKLGYDYIILARGGGSFEDLFCFNDEKLVRTIYNLETFVITGIGHEQDFTLADFVADLRAPTPTATVELTTPDISDVADEIREIELAFKDAMKTIIDVQKDTLNICLSNRYLQSPELLIEKASMKLDYYLSRMRNFSTVLNTIGERIGNINTKLNTDILHSLDKKKERLKSIEEMLKLYSTDNTLKRGYSLVYKKGLLIKNASALNPDDDIDVRLYGGSIKARVKGD